MFVLRQLFYSVHISGVSEATTVIKKKFRGNGERGLGRSWGGGEHLRLVEGVSRGPRIAESGRTPCLDHLLF